MPEASVRRTATAFYGAALGARLPFGDLSHAPLQRDGLSRAVEPPGGDDLLVESGDMKSSCLPVTLT